MKPDTIHLVYSGGKALPFIDPLRDQPKHGLSPAEYAERKRQRTMRVCTVCGPTNNRFHAKRNVCVQCHSKYKLEWQHKKGKR